MSGQYPKDLTATALTNRIVSQEYIIDQTHPRLFVPSGGPFFTTGLQIRDVATNQLLRPVTDFKALHLHEGATIESSKEVCCFLYISNPAINRVLITRQVIGGAYENLYDELLQFLRDNSGIDYASVSWSRIIGRPDTFPPAAHAHQPNDWRGYTQVIALLDRIRIQLERGDSASLSAVYQYLEAKVTEVRDTLAYNNGQYYISVDERFNQFRDQITDSENSHFQSVQSTLQQIRTDLNIAETDHRAQVGNVLQQMQQQINSIQLPPAPEPPSFTFSHNNGFPYATSSINSSTSALHRLSGDFSVVEGILLGHPEAVQTFTVGTYNVGGRSLGNNGNELGFMLRLEGIIQYGNYCGQGDTDFNIPTVTAKFYDQYQNYLDSAILESVPLSGGFARNGNVGHAMFRIQKGYDLYTLRSPDGQLPTHLQMQLHIEGVSDSSGGSPDQQILTVESYILKCFL